MFATTPRAGQHRSFVMSQLSAHNVAHNDKVAHKLVQSDYERWETCQYLGFDKPLLLHQCGTLSLFPLPLADIAAQNLDLLYHTHSMAGIAGSEGQLLEEDSVGVAGAGLKARPKIEVEANVCMVAILIVGGILDGQDVEGNHDPIYGHQNRLLFLVDLKARAVAT